MKNVLIKNNILLFLLIISLGCKKETSPILVSNKVTSTNADGIFFPYPYKELYDVLRISTNDLDKVFLYRKLTKNNSEYCIELTENAKSNSFKFPFYREVSDYEPFLSLKLDDEIEKLYYKTPEKCFVVKLQYGTGHISWNYLYEINNGVKLRDIFYTEPYKQYLGKHDTLMYLARFKVDKNVEDISLETIKTLNNDIDNCKTKEEKWLLN